MSRYLQSIFIAVAILCAGCGEPDKDFLQDQVDTATDKARNVENILNDAEVQRSRQMDEMTE